MKFFSVTSSTYEKAVEKAKSIYGQKVRIISKREVLKKRLFSKKPLCEITCYLSDNSREEERNIDFKEFEKEAITPSPTAYLSDKQKYYLKKILEKNDFTKDFSTKIIEKLNITTNCKDFDEKRLEMALIDTIISMIKFDYKSQLKRPKIFIITGPTGVGKTTSLAKIAALSNSNIHLITIDTFRVGAYEQIKNFADNLGFSLAKVENEKQMYEQLVLNNDKDTIFIDTMGKSPNESTLELHMKKILRTLNEKQIFLALSASMKYEDLKAAYLRFKVYNPVSLIVTKLDETSSIGNILSLSNEFDIPLLYLTLGQVVPSDIIEANANNILKYFTGTSLDLTKKFESQIQVKKT